MSGRQGEPCPCGSGDRFDACCGPLLAGQPAPDPERLMRSRFTANAVGDLAYLRATWHPGTCPDDLDPAPGLRWQRLEVLDAAPPTGARGFVEFRAHYRLHGRDGHLHERSRFAMQSGRWWYVDGRIMDDARASTAD